MADAGRETAPTTSASRGCPVADPAGREATHHEECLSQRGGTFCDCRGIVHPVEPGRDTPHDLFLAPHATVVWSGGNGPPPTCPACKTPPARTTTLPCTDEQRYGDGQ